MYLLVDTMAYTLDIHEEPSLCLDDFPILPEVTTEYQHQYYREQIVLLFYNLSRKNTPESFGFVENVLNSLLKSLKEDIQKSPDEFLPYLTTIYKMIGHTRDIYNGKGEHELAYMMIFVLHKYYPSLSVYCLYKFVQPICDAEISYGSWRDIKYFCDYVRKRSMNGINDTLIEICVKLMNKTFAKDVLTIDELIQKHKHTNEKPKFREHITNIAKWIPRENKKFDWLYNMLVKDWFSTFHPYMFSPQLSGQSYYGALYKCKMKYRKLVSFVNRQLDTTEIKLCSQNWNQISPNHVPQICFMKNKKQFFGSLTKNDKHCFMLHDMKKLECAMRFGSYFEDKFAIGGEYETDRPHEDYIPFTIPLSYYVKAAIDCMEATTWFDTGDRMKLLNNQWKKMSDILGVKILHNFIPMLDMSFMSNINQTDTFYSAIGIACLIAERSSLGRRVLVIDHVPTWVSLEDCTDLVSMITKIMGATKSSRATNSNIHDAISLLLFTILETKTTYTKIRDLKLVVLQTSLQSHIESLHNSMITMFYNSGQNSSRKKAFSCPTFIYWNLCQTEVSYLPGPIHLKNCLIVSGSSPSIIRELTILNNIRYNSYDFIMKILQHPRYNILETYLNNIRANYNGE
jgi:Domain of unknown function (DUF2828)